MVLRIACFVILGLAVGALLFLREPALPPLIAYPRLTLSTTSPDRDLPALEAAAAANPRDASAIRALAHAYALELLEGGDRAKYAGDALNASKNVWIVGNAAYMLRSQYNLTVQRGARKADVANLAERYFLKAKALDPSLDREKILPRLEAVVTKPEEKLDWDAAARKIRRLPVTAFPQLPSSIAAVLTARKCTVPQPFGDERPRNVIRGEFFAKGEVSWAVLCSVDGRSSILAFRNADDSVPATLATAEDRRYLQGIGGDQIGFSREIVSADYAYIVSHAYDGPKPPPIDHQGINDAFLEKASVIWYHFRGKWMTLRGAD